MVSSMSWAVSDTIATIDNTTKPSKANGAMVKAPAYSKIMPKINVAKAATPSCFADGSDRCIVKDPLGKMVILEYDILGRFAQLEITGL